MGFHNPDLYYHKLIMDLTVEKSELKNQVIRLKKQIKHQKEINYKLNSLITNQQQKEQKK
tara:strand:- start:362 stop:541 length:180 start_codon:yes stop_codon:yes gene_type:complete